MTEKIGIVEVARLKVIGTNPRTLVQVLGAVFLVLFPQLGPVAKLDPLLAPGKGVGEKKKNRKKLVGRLGIKKRRGVRV